MTLVLIVSFFTQPVVAQLYPGPISSALGEAGIASLDIIEGPFQNPAILPHLKNEFHWGFVNGQGSVTDKRDDRYWGIQLVDCSNGQYFPAAASYVSNQNTFGTNAAASEKHFVIAGGKIIYKHLAFGLAFNRRETEITGFEKMIQNDFMTGLLYTPKSDLALGFIFKNPVHADGVIPKYLQLAGLWGLGIYYIYAGSFHFRFDLTQELENNPDKKFSFAGGIESRMAEFVGVRVGYKKDELNQLNVFTAGLGFMGPKLSLSYGYQTETQKSASGRHTLDLRLPF